MIKLYLRVMHDYSGLSACIHEKYMTNMTKDNFPRTVMSGQPENCSARQNWAIWNLNIFQHQF